MFSISIKHTGAAFGDTEEEKRAEIARLVREVATKVENEYDDRWTGPIIDINGQTVGEWTLDDDE